MSRIIVGIHGLGNKPPRTILREWWISAIREGLIQIGHPGVFFQFELVYWADIFHPIPLDIHESDKKSPRYLEYPYVPAIDYEEKPPSKIRRKILDFLESKLDKIFLRKNMSGSFTSITDLIIKRYFEDLDNYYSATIPDANGDVVPAKEIIRKRLSKVLEKHSGDRVLLLAHSMGTIIAYEVLLTGEETVSIDTLVTFGSPLGQPVVLRKFYDELKKMIDLEHKPVVPENIRKNWYNLSDLEDHIAINYNLNDDFRKNSRNVTVSDQVVYNNYIHDKKRNPHKSYGYLRTPQMAEIVHRFLSADRSRVAFWLSNRWNEVRQKLLPGKKSSF